MLPYFLTARFTVIVRAPGVVSFRGSRTDDAWIAADDDKLDIGTGGAKTVFNVLEVGKPIVPSYQYEFLSVLEFHVCHQDVRQLRGCVIGGFSH